MPNFTVEIFHNVQLLDRNTNEPIVDVAADSAAGAAALKAGMALPAIFARFTGESRHEAADLLRPICDVELEAGSVAEALSDVFGRANHGSPYPMFEAYYQARVRSLSIGDVVVVDGVAHTVLPVGWGETVFDEAKVLERRPAGAA